MKKKSHKRMQMGGMAKMDDAAGRAMMKDLRGSRRAPMVAKTMSPQEGSAMIRNLRGSRGGMRSQMNDLQAMPVAQPKVAAPSATMIGSPATPIADGRGALASTLSLNKGVPAMKKGGVVKSKKMRGGGLARKGVGMALAKGGLAKRAGGCAKRGVGRGKMV